MDELEFRRRTIAQPNELDKELLEFANSSPDRQQFLNENKENLYYQSSTKDLWKMANQE